MPFIESCIHTKRESMKHKARWRIQAFCLSHGAAQAADQTLRPPRWGWVMVFHQSLEIPAEENTSGAWCAVCGLSPHTTSHRNFKFCWKAACFYSEAQGIFWLVFGLFGPNFDHYSCFVFTDVKSILFSHLRPMQLFNRWPQCSITGWSSELPQSKKVPWFKAQLGWYPKRMSTCIQK